MNSSPTPTRVPDVALVFEGGGMRASYTSGMVNTLIEAGLAFPFVGGISAGSSNTVNYLLGDTWRTRVSFTDLVLDRRFGGIGTFLRGKGYFNSDWIYRQACLPNNAIPYDFARFQSNPAELAIQGFDRDTGESVVWHRDSIATLDDLMARVQASSSLPLAMPPVRIDGHTYYDGGLGEGGGIPLHLATQAGYTRVLAVLTRPKGYRKRPPSATSRFVADLYRRYPAVRDALLTRHERYNAALDELEAMAAQGSAYISILTAWPLRTAPPTTPPSCRAIATAMPKLRRSCPPFANGSARDKSSETAILRHWGESSKPCIARRWCRRDVVGLCSAGRGFRLRLQGAA